MSATPAAPQKSRSSYPGQPLRDGDPRLEAQAVDPRGRDSRVPVSPLALLVGLPLGASRRR